MLKMIVDRQLIVVALGVFTALGVVSKVVVNITQKRMVRAAGNMNKSNHPLMRLVRAKFEHACMVSEKVENVEVFVDKYLYEYRVLGFRLHSIQRMEKTAALLCVLSGLIGAALTYSVYGMNDQVLRTGAIGAGLGILVYVFHLTTDEEYRMKMARNYMVDYLQNVCLHRYEKAYMKELEAKKAVLRQAGDSEGEKREEAKEPLEEVENALAKNVDEEEFEEVLLDEKMDKPRDLVRPEPYPVPDNVPAIRAFKTEENESKNVDRKEEKTEEREIRIRQILEEFMA